MTSPAPELQPVNIRDLRRHRELAPGGQFFNRTVEEFLPLVYGCALQLIPDQPESAASVSRAAFKALALRWRRIPRRTLIATWLVRTTACAALRERRRLRLPLPPKDSPAASARYLFKFLTRLRSKPQNALIVRFALRQSAEHAAQTLRSRPAQVEKHARAGLKKLAKALKKKNIALDPQAWLQEIASPLAPDLESQIAAHLQQWSPKEKKDELVRAVLRMWTWAGIRRAAKRTAGAIAVAAAVLAVTVLSIVWLAQHGYLTDWFIRRQQRQIVKDIPELTIPAHPWSPPPSQSPAPNQLPATAADLYSLQTIWPARLVFTANDWHDIEPSHIEPVRNMRQPGGGIVLRNPNARRSGLSGVLGFDFNWAHARLEFAGHTISNVAVRYRGNGTYINSLYGPKQSFKVELNKFVKGQKLAGIHTLNFLNSIADDSYIHDALAEQLFRDLGVPGPRTAYAYLTIDVPHKFPNRPLGLYVLMENIDGDYAADRFGSKKTPIFKPVTCDLFKDLGGDWSAYEPIYDLKTKATAAQKQRVIDFARLITHASDAELARRLPEFLDLQEFAAFLAGHVLLSSYDGFLSNGQNFYLYLNPESDQFGFISWDQDHSWGEFGYVSRAERREQASIWQPSTYPNHFLERVLKVEGFRTVYRHTLEHAMSELFTPERLFRQIDSLALVIRPAIAAESQFRLKRFDQAVSTNWLSGPRDGPPEGPKSPVHQIRRFINNRAKSVRDQLDGKSQGVVFGHHND